METIDRLNLWHGQEKGHAAKIDIDTTYGATCWTVELLNVNTKQVIFVQEVAFFADEHGNNPYRTKIPEDCEDCEKWLRGYTQYFMTVERFTGEKGWCDPSKCIEVALFIAEKEGI